MKIRTLFIALLCQLNVSALPVIAAAPEQIQIDGIKFIQNSQIYGSGIVFKACKQGLAWENPANGVNIVAAAPDWRVYTYNVASKRYCEVPLDKYEGYMLRSAIIFWGFSFPSIPYKEEDPARILGLRCRVFVMPKLGMKEKLNRGIDTLLDSKLFTTADLPVDSHILSFVRKHYNFPACGDLPVSMYVQRRDRSRQYMLQTRNISQTKFKLSEFKLPTGAIKTKNDKDVIQNVSDDSSLDGLLKDIDRKSFLKN